MSASAADLVSVVVPKYKEAENIRLLIPRIYKAMETAGLSVEVIIVDDDSQDGLEHIVEQFEKDGLTVKLEVRLGQRGLSTAVIHGFRLAQGEYLVCMDADLSHPPEKIPELISPLQSGRADFVIGSRYVPGAATDANWGLFRWLNSKIATLLAHPLASVKDPLAGFFALRKTIFLSAKDISPIGYKILLELLVKSSCKNIIEVPIHFADRKLGQSKLNLTEQVNYIKHLKRLYDYKYANFSRFFQFCLVGSTGAVVDLVCLNLLLLALRNFALSRAIAIAMAMTWNFYLNRQITFRSTREGRWYKQYFKFVTSCSFGMVVNLAVSYMLVRIMPESFISVQISALAGIACGTIINFLLVSNFVFQKKKK